MSAWKKPSRSAWRRKVWITARGEMLEVEALGFELGAIVQRRAVDPVERQHVLGGAVPVHRRHAEVRIASWCSPPSRTARRLRAAGPSRSQTERRSVATVSIRRSRRASADIASARPRGEGEGVEVDAEALLDAGTQHLDGDRLAAVRRVDLGAMHLRDRGGGDRGPNAANASFSGLPSAAVTTASASRARERRHLVLQAFEIAGERDADHVGPRRQELAELHVGRAELGQRGGEPAPRASRWSAARSAAPA